MRGSSLLPTTLKLHSPTMPTAARTPLLQFPSANLLTAVCRHVDTHTPAQKQINCFCESRWEEEQTGLFFCSIHSSYVKIQQAPFAIMEAPHEEEAKKVPPKDTMEEEQEAQEAGQLLKIDAKGRPFDAALFGETVVKGFEKMYNNPLLSDISLVVGLEKLPAHRMVLCAWSDTFRSMLENKDWAESSLHDLPIHLDDPEDQLHFKNMHVSPPAPLPTAPCPRALSSHTEDDLHLTPPPASKTQEPQYSTNTNTNTTTINNNNNNTNTTNNIWRPRVACLRAVSTTATATKGGGSDSAQVLGAHERTCLTHVVGRLGGGAYVVCRLRYMYTGSIDFVSGDNIIPLIRLSDYYGILSLKVRVRPSPSPSLRARVRQDRGCVHSSLLRRDHVACT
jgi:hypothetical protein